MHNFYDLRDGYEKGPTKVLFLDMDGVLCTTRAIVATNDHGIGRAIDPIGVGLLNRVQLEVGEDIGIVVSSTWRNLGKSMPVVLQSIGLRLTIMHNWCTTALAKTRGDEIQDWLNHHPHITDYVILDDEKDLLPHHLLKHVQTDTHDGINYKNYRDIVRIFTGRDPIPTSFAEQDWNQNIGDSDENNE